MLFALHQLFHFLNLGAGFMGGLSLWFVDFSAHVHKASINSLFLRGVIISAASSPGSLRGLNRWIHTQYLAPLSANTQQLLIVVKNQSLPLMEWMVLAPSYFTSSGLTFLICKMGSTVYLPSCSVIPDCLQPHGLWPARLFCPWNSQPRIFLDDLLNALGSSLQPPEWLKHKAKENNLNCWWR